MPTDIVLIPGALATPEIWHHLVCRFAGKQFHHVNLSDSDCIEEMARRFVSVAPERFTLIGFSMGGYVALELYRLVPDRIEKLILINSAARIVSIKGQQERERSLDLIGKGKFDLLVKLIFQNSIYEKSRHDSLLPMVQAMAHETGVKNYEKQLNAVLTKPDHSTLLPTDIGADFWTQKRFF